MDGRRTAFHQYFFRSRTEHLVQCEGDQPGTDVSAPCIRLKREPARVPPVFFFKKGYDPYNCIVFLSTEPMRLFFRRELIHFSRDILFTAKRSDGQVHDDLKLTISCFSV